MTDDLFQIPATHPPALEAARRRLAELESQRESLRTETDWDDGEFIPSQLWQRVQLEIREQAQLITRLEAEARRL